MVSSEQLAEADRVLAANPRLREVMESAISLIDAQQILAQHAEPGDMFCGLVEKYLRKRALAILADSGMGPDYAELLISHVPQR